MSERINGKLDTMSGGDVVCAGWLRKSPPEKKLRRYAWKKRWFVLRSGRLSGDPDVLEYYKHDHARKPIRSINLSLCEQVDAGLSFTKKDLESSFVFDLRTVERVFYLVADTEADMNRWVHCLCELCGFNPTDHVSERPHGSTPTSVPTATVAPIPVSMVTGSAQLPYESSGSVDEDYLWLAQCQSKRTPKGSRSEDHRHKQRPVSSSSSSSSPSSLANGVSTPPPPSANPWAVAMAARPFSQSLDSAAGPAPQRGGARCPSSPHPRKHSLEMTFHPVSLSTPSPTYQVPRRPPERRAPSVPGTEPPAQAELRGATPTPPPRPPKSSGGAAQPEAPSLGTASATLPRSSSEPERGERGGGGGGGGGGGRAPRCNTISTSSGYRRAGVQPEDSYDIPRSFPDRASMFDFSDSFNSYFVSKGMLPLGTVGVEDEDVDENYVPMSAATTEPPATFDPPPPQDPDYVPMTPLPPSSLPGEPALPGRRVPPPVHPGFRCSPRSLTPPTGRRAVATRDAPPPPVHRNLKPQPRGTPGGAGKPLGLERTDSQTVGEFAQRRKVKPAPLHIDPLPEWEEVPPPVRSPVTRTFTRDPSRQPIMRPCSNQSLTSDSDSDDPDDNYVAMTTSSLSLSGKDTSLRLTVHRASDGECASSPLLQRPRGNKQVEYLDLDLHTGRATPPRQKRWLDGGGSVCVCEERVDYVVVDPERTRALKNTREAWHDGRQSTDK